MTISHVDSCVVCTGLFLKMIECRCVLLYAMSDACVAVGVSYGFERGSSCVNYISHAVNVSKHSRLLESSTDPHEHSRLQKLEV